ncbi:MAG: hypothetical protein FGF51_07795 [Candidatus Brockarchaeota archaeon]|nr:hypothetical protein [Candidatus Brockarchaeota archaeon]
MRTRRVPPALNVDDRLQGKAGSVKTGLVSLRLTAEYLGRRAVGSVA